jgi:hypothetical protein
MPPSYSLEPAASKSLGPVTPELAWVQVRTQFNHVVEENWAAGEDLRKYEGLEIDLVGLQQCLGAVNPVRFCNLLVYSNPDLDLRSIPSCPPLHILKAVLSLMQCDRYQSTGSSVNS